MSHTHLSKGNKNQELRSYKMDTDKNKSALSDVSSKYVIGRKDTESPKFIRKYLYGRKSKYNNDSLEDDHSRKSSMGSVGDGMGGEKDVINIINKGGPTTIIFYHFRVANGRRSSCIAHSSPQETIQEILPGFPWTHTLKNSNHLVLRSTTTSEFSSIDSFDSAVPKSTNGHPKRFSFFKRSQFVSQNNKSVSVDECHLNGHRYEGNTSSDSSKRTSQNSLLQLPASNGYKASMS